MAPFDAAELRSDLEVLASVLLPEVTERPSGEGSADPGDIPPLAAEPTEAEAMRIRAYIILAHAALEEALEVEIYEAVSRCMKVRGASPPAVALSLAAKYADELIGANRGRVPSPLMIANSVPGLYYSKVVKPNNGIRRNSLAGLCKPLGIDIEALGGDFDAALLKLDLLGAKRGSAAHTLRAAALETVLAEDAKRWVFDAVEAMEVVLSVLLELVERREIAAETGTDYIGE